MHNRYQYPLFHCRYVVLFFNIVMKVCNVNINGLQNKKTEIINYIKGRDVDILCIQEVKCHQRKS